MNTVKAKFMCHSIIPNSWNGKSVTVHMNAVYGENGENADYSKATPCGNLSLCIDQDVPASTFFKQGECYYLTFEPENK